MAAARRRAWATLLSKTYYIQAVLVLAQSLRDVDSRYPLIVMVVPDLPEYIFDILRLRGLSTRPIQYLKPAEGRHKVDPHDIRFEETWGKLRSFSLDEYERVVLLDSDMIVRRNMDELMHIPLPSDWIAAVHVCACNPMNYAHYPRDWKRENCAHTPMEHPRALHHPAQILPDSPRAYRLLNSGMVVLTPSKKIMLDLEHFLDTSPLVPGFKFPDQDLLAAVFKGRFQPLPWKYNALKTLKTIHPTLWCDEEIRCLHYVLRDKPWHYRRGEAPPEYEYLHKWWYDTFDRVLEEMKQIPGSHWEKVQAEMAD